MPAPSSSWVSSWMSVCSSAKAVEGEEPQLNVSLILLFTRCLLVSPLPDSYNYVILKLLLGDQKMKGQKIQLLFPVSLRRYVTPKKCFAGGGEVLSAFL